MCVCVVQIFAVDATARIRKTVRSRNGAIEILHLPVCIADDASASVSQLARPTTPPNYYLLPNRHPHIHPTVTEIGCFCFSRTAECVTAAHGRNHGQSGGAA